MNTNKIDLIKAEVERIQLYTQSEVLKQVLDYIEKVQEEPMPKFKAGDHIRPIDSCLGAQRTILEVCDGWYVTNQGTLDFEFEDNWEAVEEPVSKEIGDYDHKAVMESLHPELKEEPVSEDLGEYINELSKQFPEVSFAKLSRIAVRVAKWKEQQLMAKAIDGDITFDYYGDDNKTYGCIAHDSFCLEDFGLKDRDKVKVIVIKDD